MSIGLCLLLLLSAYAVNGTPAAKSTPGKLALFNSHISHIIFLMQENRAFDDLFGEYCPTLGAVCSSTANGIPPGTCVPRDPANLSLGCMRPYNFTRNQLSTIDLQHDWISTHSAWNNGSMDNFYLAEHSHNETFGHYNASTVPLYYDLAEQYSLGDNFFSGSQSQSLPNHWYEVAAMPPPLIQYNYTGVSKTFNFQYLNQSNATPNIESELVNSTVSWKYYDYGLPSYQAAIGGVPGTFPVAYDLWNPLAARAQSYLTGVKSHFVPRSQLFNDAKNGTLPNVSWVVPTPLGSDHPPQNLTLGQNWVASVVDALEASPEWNSTVLFVSWDEYGGFYDHVPPPTLDIYGAGFRVPLLAIGPWVRQGFIDHVSMNFDSILHLMEKRFALPCIGARDCNAVLPLAMFNFQRAQPRYPIGFPTNGTAAYPMPLQSTGTLPHFGAMSTFRWMSYEGSPDAAQASVIDWA